VSSRLEDRPSENVYRHEERAGGRRLRAAVVGAGSVGSIHATALAEHPGVALVAVCGRTRPKTESLALVHGVPFYLSVERLMEAERPDIVCVCTGNDQHVEPTIAALERGAHVFVEKPMAFRLEDAHLMAQAAERAERKLGVDFNHRFAEPYQRALSFVREGNLGTQAFVCMKFAGDLYPSLNDPYCMLIETQGHSFDLFRLFAGDIEEVSAFLTDPRRIGVFTSAAISLRFANGAVGTLLGSWDSSYSHPRSVVFELSGTEGRVEVENIVDSVRMFRTDQPGSIEWHPGLFDRRRDFWRTIDAHIGAFVDAVRDDREPPVSAADGIMALEATFAAIRSFEEGAPVTLQTH
jgi:myo-inositol 2-dehydrogenase / D-chiro-inositol 1-dehydrogenase